MKMYKIYIGATSISEIEARKLEEDKYFIIYNKDNNTSMGLIIDKNKLNEHFIFETLEEAANCLFEQQSKILQQLVKVVEKQRKLVFDIVEKYKIGGGLSHDNV